jgi:deoxyribodipyrimidine photo-lyase
MKPAIWWIRRDLRLKDNQALQAALVEHPSILPLFILDQHIYPFQRARNTFLYANLAALDSHCKNLETSLSFAAVIRLKYCNTSCKNVKADAISPKKISHPMHWRETSAQKQRFTLHLAPAV